MPRPLWSGAISFGLVNIPVKMYNSVSKKALHFNQLRREDGCRIRLKKVCSSDGQEVANEDIIKGYEVSPDRYVTVDAEELEALNPKASRSIEIEDFVKIEQIDPLFFEQSYYLVPDKGAAKAYSLLLAAMKKTGKVAIARVVMRNKQHLTTIRPVGRAMTMSTMHFADEIITQEQLEDLPAEDAIPNDRELAMAEQIIESLTADFAIEKYHDDYRRKVLEMIERKAEGEAIVAEPVTREPGKVVDLMAALEASLSAMKKKKPEAQTSPVGKDRRKKARA